MIGPETQLMRDSPTSKANQLFCARARQPSNSAFKHAAKATALPRLQVTAAHQLPVSYPDFPQQVARVSVRDPAGDAYHTDAMSCIAGHTQMERTEGGIHREKVAKHLGPFANQSAGFL